MENINLDFIIALIAGVRKWEKDKHFADCYVLYLTNGSIAMVDYATIDEILIDFDGNALMYRDFYDCMMRDLCA